MFSWWKLWKWVISNPVNAITWSFSGTSDRLSSHGLRSSRYDPPSASTLPSSLFVMSFGSGNRSSLSYNNDNALLFNPIYAEWALLHQLFGRVLSNRGPPRSLVKREQGHLFQGNKGTDTPPRPPRPLGGPQQKRRLISFYCYHVL